MHRSYILRTQVGNHPVESSEHKIVYQPAFTKAHLMFGRMDIDVYQRRIKLQIEHIGRMTAVKEHILIGLTYRMGNHLVTDDTAIDKEILLICLRTGKGRQAHPAPKPQPRGFRHHIQRHRFVDKALAEQLCKTLFTCLLTGCRSQLMNHLAVMTQTEADVVTAQGQPLDHLFKMTKLGFLGLKKLAPRGGVEEQIPHFHGGAGRMGCRYHFGRHVTTLRRHGPSIVLIRRARRQRQTRHRAYTGQRLTAKAQAADGFKIFQRSDLGGGMTTQGQRQIRLIDAATVIAQADQLDATLLGIQLDAIRSRVQAVFQQLLDHGSGPFNNLAGRNLVSQLRR